MYYGLDDVGARVWQLIQEPTVVKEIQATILEEYGVEPERGERDVLALLQDLANEGLIEVKDEAPA
jgi:translation initiation factor 2 beta subunit (eIF-2beta)/eIF-5